MAGTGRRAHLGLDGRDPGLATANDPQVAAVLLEVVIVLVGQFGYSFLGVDPMDATLSAGDVESKVAVEPATDLGDVLGSHGGVERAGLVYRHQHSTLLLRE